MDIHERVKAAPQPGTLGFLKPFTPPDTFSDYSRIHNMRQYIHLPPRSYLNHLPSIVMMFKITFLSGLEFILPTLYGLRRKKRMHGKHAQPQ